MTWLWTTVDLAGQLVTVGPHEVTVVYWVEYRVLPGLPSREAAARPAPAMIAVKRILTVGEVVVVVVVVVGEGEGGKSDWKLEACVMIAVLKKSGRPKSR